MVVGVKWADYSRQSAAPYALRAEPVPVRRAQKPPRPLWVSSRTPEEIVQAALERLRAAAAARGCGCQPGPTWDSYTGWQKRGRQVQHGQHATTVYRAEVGKRVEQGVLVSHVTSKAVWLFCEHQTVKIGSDNEPGGTVRRALGGAAKPAPAIRLALD